MKYSSTWILGAVALSGCATGGTFEVETTWEGLPCGPSASTSLAVDEAATVGISAQDALALVDGAVLDAVFEVDNDRVEPENGFEAQLQIAASLAGDPVEVGAWEADCANLPAPALRVPITLTITFDNGMVATSLAPGEILATGPALGDLHVSSSMTVMEVSNLPAWMEDLLEEAPPSFVERGEHVERELHMGILGALVSTWDAPVGGLGYRASDGSHVTAGRLFSMDAQHAP